MPKRSGVRLTPDQRDLLERMLEGEALVFSPSLVSYGLVGQQFTFTVEKRTADALIGRGLIVASGSRGDRSRPNTVYSITDSGRAALKGE